ncbi:MAG: tetratricopeptide repeat protein [Candidatus Krumholzibacteriia bacterium]
MAGCAKYNTYFNAKRAFDNAEYVREEAIRKHEDPPQPSGLQKSNYETAIQKAQKVLDEYPGHGLIDDALFLQAKAWHRLEGYRMSIRKLDLLFQNFPATDHLEESLYLQGLNYLLIGSLDKSQQFLAQLARRYPDSRYQAEVQKVSGDNAYALENWEKAAAAYRLYLEDPDADERDRVGLKLAECQWELGDYLAAAEVLKEVSDSSESAELGFRARLLRARVHVRLGDHALAETLLGELRGEAEVYNARGDVRLVEAESMLAQERSGEVSALLESMPADWQTPAVKAQAADMLGYLYLERGEWEQARTSFQEALRRRDDLEEPERTRRLHDTLKDFMAADQALVDAQGERAAELRLQKANALLFGFERPREALDLYAAAAADTAATPAVAARSLYGALITWRDHLDRPDSGQVYADLLLERFPESPQAYEALSGRRSELLGYLLDRRQQEQAARLAAMTPEERLALESGEALAITAGGGPRRPGAGAGLRRRQVYLSRRPNLTFPPTPAELALAAELAGQDRAQAARQAAADSVRNAATAAAAAADTSAPPPVRPPAGAEIGGGRTGDLAPLPSAVAGPDSLAPAAALPDTAGQDGAQDEGEEDEKAEEKKKDTFDLR